MFYKKSILSNSIWMISEKFINIFGLIFINSYMAKYIGPENFGKIIFATSLFAFVQVISWFGSQNIIFKRISERPENGIYLALGTNNLRIYLLFFSSSFILFYLYFYSDSITLYFGIANFIASYFIVSDVFSIYNNSLLISYINTITNVIGLIVALISRFLISSFELDIIWFVFPIILFPMVSYFLRRIYFFKKTILKRKLFKNNNLKYNKYILKTGGALLLSTLSIALYTQISSLFLAKLVSYKDLGLYSISLTLGSAWSFILQAIITSNFSKIYLEKNYITIKNTLSRLYIFVFFTTLLVLIGFLIVGKYFIKFLYGEDYLDVIKFIPIAIIGTMFSCVGTICYRYMIKENGYNYLSIKMFSVSVVSIISSYFLIKSYGIYGALYCYVLIEFISCTIANYYFKNGMMFKQHLYAFKYIITLIERKK